jgi:putative acyl-CoA dehydrogenase
VLAQADSGLTCFLLPRVLPDGSRNVFRLQRLKDKLGNRSNASAEVEFDGTVGWRVGPEGRGVPTILEMVTVTRLDCVLGSAATVRAATAQAIHHATHRRAFGRPLREQPVMRAVLADVAVEAEAATALALRLASTMDSGEAELGRLATAVGKFWVCKRAAAVTAEALECLGGNGYVEESGMPRLYREAPLNSIWEGSGNVIALDVLRAVTRQPEAVAAFLAEVEIAAGADNRLDAAVKRLRTELADTDRIEPRARRVASLMALCLQGSLLVRYAPAAVADAFCASRLDGDWGWVLGTLPTGLAERAIVDRAAPLPDR